MNSVLIVDSDGKSLASVQRKLRKNMETHIALGARQGMQRIREDGPYAVVIAEFSMEEIDGISFLAQVREEWPDTVRVLITRSPMDVADMLRAINDGKIFHLIAASCEEATLLTVVDNALAHYSKCAAAARELNQTHAVFAKAVHEIVCWLREDIRDMLSPVLPVLRGVSARLNDPSPMVTETAFLLSVIGLINLPARLLDKIVHGQVLSDAEWIEFAGHPEHAVEFFRHLPHLREVSETLRGYSNFLHISLLPPDESSVIPPMPVGSTLLALIMEYRLQLYRKTSLSDTLSMLKERAVHDSLHMRALRDEIGNVEQTEEKLTLDQLRPGMILTEPVLGTREGREVVLVPDGYELSRTTIVFLRQTARHGHVREPVSIRRGNYSSSK